MKAFQAIWWEDIGISGVLGGELQTASEWFERLWRGFLKFTNPLDIWSSHGPLIIGNTEVTMTAFDSEKKKGAVCVRKQSPHLWHIGTLRKKNVKVNNGPLALEWVAFVFPGPLRTPPVYNTRYCGRAAAGTDPFSPHFFSEKNRKKTKKHMTTLCEKMRTTTKLLREWKTPRICDKVFTRSRVLLHRVDLIDYVVSRYSSVFHLVNLFILHEGLPLCNTCHKCLNEN